MNYKILPDNSRVWIYQCDRELSSKEIQEIKSHGENFLKSWNSHGEALVAAFEIFYNRFITLFIDENYISASGCSIDKAVLFMKQIEKDFSISLFDRMKIAYRENGGISHFSFHDFENLLQKKIIHENTIVFNNVVSTKKEFYKNWEIPLKESWLMQNLRTTNV